MAKADEDPLELIVIAEDVEAVCIGLADREDVDDGDTLALDVIV